MVVLHFNYKTLSVSIKRDLLINVVFFIKESRNDGRRADKARYLRSDLHTYQFTYNKVVRGVVRSLSL